MRVPHCLVGRLDIGPAKTLNRLLLQELVGGKEMFNFAGNMWG